MNKKLASFTNSAPAAQPVDPGQTGESLQSTQPAGQGFAVRANPAIEAAVERGMVAAMWRSVCAGALIMFEEGVPLSVATRVLLHPKQRRASDWRH